MLDFSPIWDRTTTLSVLMADLSRDDLRRLTNEVTDTVLGLIETCVDADVVFVPKDSQANDSEHGQGWTLGHVIVHMTAGAEETSFLAAELARGIEHHGRSRYEVPWEEVTTIEFCRQRLQESRRMRLATLDIWPDQPHLENRFEMAFLNDRLNAYGYFGLGLLHDSMHYGQIAEIVRQAQAARAC